MQLPSIQQPIVFINLNYMAACFDQRTVIFRPVRDIIIKLHLNKHDVHLWTYKTNKIILLNRLQVLVYLLFCVCLLSDVISVTIYIAGCGKYKHQDNLYLTLTQCGCCALRIRSSRLYLGRLLAISMWVVDILYFVKTWAI